MCPSLLYKTALLQAEKMAIDRDRARDQFTNVHMCVVTLCQHTLLRAINSADIFFLFSVNSEEESMVRSCYT